MSIIDAHIHLWDLSQQINSWVIKSQNPNWLKDIGLNDYLTVSQLPAITGVVTIEAADARHSLDEVKWLDQVRRRHSIELKHIAYLDMLQAPVDFVAKVNEYKCYDFVIGFRDIMSYSHQPVYSPCANDITLSTANLDRLYFNLCYLAENNYIFDCQMYPEQLIRAFASIQKSQVKCVIDHAGLPTLDNFASWIEMLQLYNGVAEFKLSGLDLNEVQDNSRQICEQLVENIPLGNIHYGSNFPVTPRIHNDYLLEALNQIVNPEDLNQIMYLNSQRFYNFS